MSEAVQRAFPRVLRIVIDLRLKEGSEEQRSGLRLKSARLASGIFGDLLF